MKFIRSLLSKLQGGAVPALSLSFTGDRCRWVYGVVERRGQLSFKAIYASGGCELVGVSADEVLLSSNTMQKAISDSIRQLPPSSARPLFAVFTVSAKHAYLGEISVGQNDREGVIRDRIRDLMEQAAGQSDREAAFDWQPRLELADGSVSLAVAGIDQRQVDEILSACQACNLNCLGITIDSVAAMNGYMQMAPDSMKSANGRFLLHGELSRNRIRLAVFSQGVLVTENMEQSDENFSIVQAVSALERLVSIWVRDGVSEDVAAVKLILGGELMYTKGCEATVKRSQTLARHLVAVPPRKELQAHWHDDVVPFGALEAMPCE